jgi:hypothetical protein
LNSKGYIVIAKSVAVRKFNIPITNRVAIVSDQTVQAVNNEWTHTGDIDFAKYFYSLEELESKTSDIEHSEKLIDLLSQTVESLLEANRTLRNNKLECCKNGKQKSY